MTLNAAWVDLTHPIVAKFIVDNPTQDPDEMTALCEVASRLLHRGVGGKYPGVGVDTFRPNRSTCCRDQARTGCRWVREIELPNLPVVSIESVTVDGTVRAATTYRVDDRRWLVNLPNAEGVYDENAAWPCCQRIDLDPTEEETMEIAYRYGAVAPVEAQRAAARLAVQLAAADLDDCDECVLDDDVQSIARQGVTKVLRQDPDEVVRGIRDVELWLWAERHEQDEAPATFIDPYQIAKRGPMVRRPDYTPSTQS